MNATNYAEEFAQNHHLRALDHYRHAREKHPYFADCLTVRPPLSTIVPFVDLNIIRKKINEDAAQNNTKANDVFQCEYAEFLAELSKHNNSRAVEELYDAIAVLLRMVDVLEGRQKLGKPEVEK